MSGKKNYPCDEHLAQIEEMRLVYAESLTETRALRESQVQMTALLQSLDNNIKQGIGIAQSVIKVFSQVVLVFLLVVVGMCATVVWVSRIDIEYNEKGFKVTQPDNK